ncbi:hypothetical protein H072_3028 [Dactylellina haptotyla CBS 200.50]|uniref:Uncharacterized protein n=1 Tax=Dactylellina haptotyla (strain CBS 200.50) TaxID=1284197 RepID=S8BU18_DACHA|nr:hypothetical protein H072_3028 [Dactylellina haptotyla CBS 200.50]
MPLTSASLSLLQQSQRNQNNLDLVVSYVAKQAAYPLRRGGVEGERATSDNPASIDLRLPSKSRPIEEIIECSEGTAWLRSQQKGNTAQRDGSCDKSPEAALALDGDQAKEPPRKRQRSSSSMISPIKENYAKDGSRDGSKTCSSPRPTSPTRNCAGSQRPMENGFERPKRHKMRESRHLKKHEGKPKKRKKERSQKQETAKQAQVSQPAFGTLASSAVESGHLSGGRLTVKPQATTGLFHKGKVSSLKSRAALPDLTFSEMEFLRQGTSANYRPLTKEGKNTASGAGQKQGKHNTTAGPEKDISSYFRRIESIHGKENIDPRTKCGVHGSLSGESDYSEDEARFTIGQREFIRKNNKSPAPESCQRRRIRDPGSSELIQSSESFRTLGPPIKTGPSTILQGTSLNVHEGATFRSLSVNSSGGDAREKFDARPSSEIHDPVMTWIRNTTRELDKMPNCLLAQYIDEPYSNPGSSIRGFNDAGGMVNATTRRSEVLRSDLVTNPRSDCLGESIVLDPKRALSIDIGLEREILLWRSGQPPGSPQYCHHQESIDPYGDVETSDIPINMIGSRRMHNFDTQTQNIPFEMPPNSFKELDDEMYDNFNGCKQLVEIKEGDLVIKELPEDCYRETLDYGFHKTDTVEEINDYSTNYEVAMERGSSSGDFFDTGLESENIGGVDAEFPELNDQSHVIEITQGSQKSDVNTEEVQQIMTTANVEEDIPLGPKNFWKPHRLY